MFILSQKLRFDVIFNLKLLIFQSTIRSRYALNYKYSLNIKNMEALLKRETNRTAFCSFIIFGLGVTKKNHPPFDFIIEVCTEVVALCVIAVYSGDLGIQDPISTTILA